MALPSELGLLDFKTERVGTGGSPIRRSPAKRATSISPRKSPTKRIVGSGFIKKEGLELEFGDVEPTRLIVGIDCGTTYSGVAFARSNVGTQRVNVITTWDESGDNRDKVPTALAVSHISDDASELWGYGIRPDVSSVTWFKLGMAGNDIAIPQDDPLLKQALGKCTLEVPEGTNAENLCKDYLGHLHRHVMQRLEMHMTAALLKSTPIDYVLTTPADWGQSYKAKLKAQARAAGIGERDGDKIVTIDEPEAAALAVFAEAKGFSDELIQVGANLVVVDMGGGTVDVITYNIVKTDPLVVREACTGSSARCGGTTVDRALHELMAQKYGPAFTEKPPSEIGHGSTFMRYFESIKRTFDGRKKRYRLPLVLALNAEDVSDDKWTGEITVTRDEISDMFSRVINPTLELLCDQAKRSREENDRDIKLVVLCGGLSGSPWVQTKIKNFTRKQLGIDNDPVVPLSPWSAIARGAVVHGLKPKGIVDSRKCRWSYGISLHRQFDPRRDDEEDAFECPVSGKRASGCMKWHVKRGNTVKRGRQEYIDTFVVQDKRGRPSFKDIILYKCKDANPPDKVDRQGIEVLGKLRITLSGIAKQKGMSSGISKNAAGADCD